MEIFSNNALLDTCGEGIYSSTSSIKVLNEALLDSRTQFESRKEFFEMSLQHCYTKKMDLLT